METRENKEHVSLCGVMSVFHVKRGREGGNYNVNLKTGENDCRALH